MRSAILFGEQPTPHLHIELYRSIKSALDWGAERQRSAGGNNIQQAYYSALGYAMHTAANALPDPPRGMSSDLIDSQPARDEWAWNHAAMWAKPIFVVTVPETGNVWLPNRQQILTWLEERAAVSGQTHLRGDLARFKYRNSWREMPWRPFAPGSRNLSGGIETAPGVQPADLVTWSPLLFDYDHQVRRGPIRLGTHVQNLHVLNLA